MLQLGKTDIFESLNQLKIQQIRGNVQTLTNYLQIAEKVIKRYYHYLNTIIKSSIQLPNNQELPVPGYDSQQIDAMTWKILNNSHR